jgi:hypothetical protein
VADAVVVGRGPGWFLVEGSEARFLGEAAPDARDAIPESVVQGLRRLPSSTSVNAESEELAARLRDRCDRPIGAASLAVRRHARASLPTPDPRRDRAYLLALARRRLEEALRAPEEILITLAREEERLERALGREERAAESFLALEGSPLAEYSAAWTQVRQGLVRHHHELEASVARLVRSVAPNLTAVVGERAAARLLSGAGGLGALARLRAPRLQLLGTRRRPSAEHGPRYGILYRAARMTDVPPGRRGAYARSLAALAAIAARADASTRRDLTPLLVPRRDRRVEQLRRRPT